MRASFAILPLASKAKDKQVKPHIHAPHLLLDWEEGQEVRGSRKGSHKTLPLPRMKRIGHSQVWIISMYPVYLESIAIYRNGICCQVKYFRSQIESHLGGLDFCHEEKGGLMHTRSTLYLYSSHSLKNMLPHGTGGWASSCNQKARFPVKAHS